MGENFAFFLPVMMASFSIAFLALYSRGVRVAGWWSAAYFYVSAGFSVPLAYAAVAAPVWSLLADLLFATGFLFFSEALLQRWRPYWLLRTRIAIWGLSCLLCTTAIAIGNLPLELAASDFGCFLLTALPLVAARARLKSGADRILFGAAVLVALDHLVRGSTVPITITQGTAFLGSEYAFLTQALACIFGLFLALAALATQVFDLLARYERQAMIDPLSGLLNRRGFDEAVGQLHSKARSGSLIVCDIDHFKAVNDEFGHALGDRVIIALARRLEAAALKHGISARFGGEEFVLFLPGADAARAAAIADDVREGFTREIGSTLPITRKVTASFGLSTVQHADASIHDTIARADKALYEAKSRGRNRVCVRRALSSPEAPPRPSAPAVIHA